MALRNQPYLPLYIQDFLTDEKLSECSAESTGVYIRLMCLMHKSQAYGTILLKQKDIQTDIQIKNFALKLVRQMPYSVEVIERSLEELIEEDVITIDGDCLYQKRMVRDAKLSDTRALSVSKRWSNNKKDGVVHGFEYTNECTNPITNPENEIESENETESDNQKSNGNVSISTTKPKRKSILSAAQLLLFEKFYNEYPKKVDRATAERAWSKIEPQPDEAMTEKIIQALNNSKKYDSRFRERQFTPNPASWLNAKGYLNEYEQEDEKNYGGFNAAGGHNQRSTSDYRNFKPSTGFKGGNGNS